MAEGCADDGQLYMSGLLNSRYVKQAKVGHGIPKGCKAMGKPEKRQPAIPKSLQCTFELADMQSETFILNCNIYADETLQRDGEPC